MKMSSPKFLMDENVDLRPIPKLRSLGIDIVSIKEENLRGKDDITILEYAGRISRAIITQDRDFPRLHNKGKRHSGIIFITKPLRVGTAIREIRKVHKTYSAEDLKNQVIYIPKKEKF